MLDYVQVSPLESAVHGGTKVAEKEFVVLIEMLMMQLLKLDSIEAEGEAKVKRRIEVTWHPLIRFSMAYEFVVGSTGGFLLLV